jgi:hypothetical protein
MVEVAFTSKGLRVEERKGPMTLYEVKETQRGRGGAAWGGIWLLNLILCMTGREQSWEVRADAQSPVTRWWLGSAEKVEKARHLNTLWD